MIDESSLRVLAGLVRRRLSQGLRSRDRGLPVSQRSILRTGKDLDGKGSTVRMRPGVEGVGLLGLSQIERVAGSVVRRRHVEEEGGRSC